MSRRVTADILNIVYKHADPATIRTVAYLSHASYAIAVPHMYRVIDIVNAIQVSKLREAWQSRDTQGTAATGFQTSV